jgi:hypothetical protein
MRQFGGIARFSAFGLSRAEVIMKFQEIVSETDFVREAQQWPILTAEMEKGFDVLSTLVFVAYFIAETD